MRFKASFFELAMVYGLSAYVLGGVCIFGCTWHNVPASLLAFIGTVYCVGRGMECLAAWLNAKWHGFLSAQPESRPKAENRTAHDLRDQSAPRLPAPYRNADTPIGAFRASPPHARADYGRRLVPVN
jgi:hypothetical protein